MDNIVVGERLRDKNAVDYLETIRENEKLAANKMKINAKLKQRSVIGHRNDESFEPYNNDSFDDQSSGSTNA